MTRIFNVYEAQAILPQLIEDACKGDEIIIRAEDGFAVRLVPIIEPEMSERNTPEG